MAQPDKGGNVGDTLTTQCYRCDQRQDRDDPVEALTWVPEREGQRLRWLCPACARAHVREIEGKLSHEYW
ncbi:hypothetical protein [Goodfellowiella coeruleoviolacea]|uniref:Uncharacterized protein n=1 Tax=Goodfellowiella coeruleoviolacea TaxID=334858 RepID=A0AAE3GGM7_9PSEU|nr:hypothetical protein [Goodfellowiella coeruleoviolacea]MCP2167896.1 hypothetical protein [Goodfellowiella coeruleoviolacea]